MLSANTLWHTTACVNRLAFKPKANQNFSQPAKQSEDNGCVVIFKNNRPKFVLLDVSAMKAPLPCSDERPETAAQKEISRAKWL